VSRRREALVSRRAARYICSPTAETGQSVDQTADDSFDFVLSGILWACLVQGRTRSGPSSKRLLVPECVSRVKAALASPSRKRDLDVVEADCHPRTRLAQDAGPFVDVGVKPADARPARPSAHQFRHPRLARASSLQFSSLVSAAVQGTSGRALSTARAAGTNRLQTGADYCGQTN
jgi:hypothetical protein